MADDKMTKEDAVREAINKAREAAEAQAEEEAVKASDEAEETSEEAPAEGEEAEETAADAGSEDTGSEDTGKKKLFKKKNKKDPRDERIEELTDLLKRNRAEFDNYRKRTDKEKARNFEFGACEVLNRILPVVDNFERGLASISEDSKEDPIVVGMEMIYKQLGTVLEELGVKPIEAVGAPFDPEFHNAVMHVEDEELGENIVVEEFQKGYTYKETVLRHSMVKVAN